MDTDKGQRLRPDDLEALIGQGGRLLLQRDFEGAAALARSALALDPDNRHARDQLDAAKAALGHPDGDAIGGPDEPDRKRVFAPPATDEALGHQLQTAVAAGRFDEATDLVRRAIGNDPENAHLHGQLGNLLSHLGDRTGALASYRRAAAISPDDAGAQAALGNAWMRSGEPAQAADCYRAALAIDPEAVDARRNLGTALRDCGDLDGAIAAYRRALDGAPNDAAAHYNLAIALSDFGAFARAAMHYRRALALASPSSIPDRATILNNLGNALKNQGAVPRAIAAFRRAQMLKPGYAMATYNEALALLLSGDYRQGFAKYESRWQRGPMAPPRPETALPRWSGEPTEPGAGILVFHEQGLGDAIMMSRYLPLLRERFAAVTCLAAEPLARLFRHSLGDTGTVVTDRRQAPDTGSTHHCPIMSLPVAFGTDLDGIPPADGVLRPDSDAVAAWAARTPTGRHLRVGLVWAGRRDNAMDRFRSLPLAALRPLLAVDGVAVFSLQKDEARAEIAAEGLSGQIQDPMDACRDFMDTAALIATLDLVVAVDTAAAHLAGALGTPVWLLNRFQSEWRWLRDRTDSPWYPSMRLFTQPRPGDWAAVTAEVAARLRLQAAGRHIRFVRPARRRSSG